MKMPHPATEVLTLPDLAALLQVSLESAETLVSAHSIPHTLVEGSPRFVRHLVLGWLERSSVPGGAELMPPPPPAPPRSAGPVFAGFAPVAPGETPWINGQLTSALAEGSKDPNRNLERLQIRDALLALNDALLPTLGRLSGGALRPDPNEATRTSAWRLETAVPGAITAMSMAWGKGPLSEPQFADRPRIQIELSHGLLRVAFETEGRVLRCPPDELESLEGAGLALDTRDADGDRQLIAAARVYTVPSEGVTAATVTRALHRDLELLVPLWCRIEG